MIIAADSRRLPHALGDFLGAWLDRTRLTPGSSWREEIESAMNRSAAVVLMWGKEGLGPVQLQERDLAYAIRDNDRSLRELNVLLPGSPAPKGSWANIDTWIMFDGGPDDPDAFASLVAAIKGEARSAVRSCTSGFEVSQHSSSVQ